MLLRLLGVFILAIAVSGCASTQMKTQNEQIESRVTDLEKSVQAKDAEIVDLQYQVKDLSSKVDGSKPAEADQAAPQASQDSTDQADSVKVPEGADSAQIVRVKVNPEKIQRALKSAGVYTGRVDGKIGPGTKEAIIEFQKSHGLKADGVLGKKTWDELKVFLK
jgi:peptidoglycan hydrolase-like protein with peptidoglycan-binding domain